MKKQLLNSLVLIFSTLFSVSLAAQSGPRVPPAIGNVSPGENQFAAAPPYYEFVHIEGGTFTMGSPETEVYRDSDEIQHRVTVSGFYMGRHEVTQAEYEAVMGQNPSSFRGTNLPVENVSWYDAVEYCNRRSEREGLTQAYTINRTREDPNNKADEDSDTVRWLVTWNRNADGYRLPTEAEWEYACRAGTTSRSPYSTGTFITTDQANYGYTYSRTTEAGRFAANGWELYDMHGNVLEWCWDWYSYEYNSDAQDPKGASSGAYRVNRGGSWGNNAQNLRSAFRSSDTPSYRFYYLGFRLVRPY